MDKPRSVVIAVILLWITLVLGIATGVYLGVTGFIYLDVLVFLVPLDIHIILYIGAVGWLALLISQISAGRNWARIIYGVPFLLGQGILCLITKPDVYHIVFIIQAVIQAYALFLLFTKPGSTWFQKDIADMDKPKADMDKPKAVMDKPKNVVIAVNLLWAFIFLGFTYVALTSWGPCHDSPAQDFGWEFGYMIINFVSALFALLLALLIFQISAGRNWARITFGVLILLGLIVNIFFPLPTQIGHLSKMAVLIMTNGLGAYALFLLFTKPGSTWFEKAVTDRKQEEK